jgi:hypothetical protein
MNRLFTSLLLSLSPLLGMSQAQAYELFGASYKWGDKVLGTPGGTVTYSILNQGVLCSPIASDWNLVSRNCVTTSPVRTFGTDFSRIFGQAFAAWSQWANIDFVEVFDDGLPSRFDGGAEHAGQIRIAATPFVTTDVLGFSIVLPNAAPYGEGGDIFINSRLGLMDQDELLPLAMHEIGHALGLAHSDLLASIMTSFDNGLRSLQADDIAAIQAVYGARIDNVPEPGSAVLALAALTASMRLGAKRRRIGVGCGLDGKPTSAIGCSLT